MPKEHNKRIGEAVTIASAGLILLALITGGLMAGPAGPGVMANWEGVWRGEADGTTTHVRMVWSDGRVHGKLIYLKHGDKEYRGAQLEGAYLAAGFRAASGRRLVGGRLYYDLEEEAYCPGEIQRIDAKTLRVSYHCLPGKTETEIWKRIDS